MPKKIYGVDPNGNFTTKDVKNAIIACFTKAHEKILNDYREYSETEISEKEMEEIKKINVESLIKKLMKKNNGNFENPKKEDLIKLCDELAIFASNFRDKKTVEKNYKQIIRLIKKLK